MKIVLEGCDGTGKSTLANLLANKYHLDICHCTQHDPADYKFYKQTIRKENIVWDRHVVGELIYPEVFDRKPQICEEDARLVVLYGKEAGTKFFILDDDIEVIKERLTATKGREDSRVLDKIEWIKERFLWYAEMFDIPVINTRKLTIPEIFAKVEEPNKPLNFVTLN